MSLDHARIYHWTNVEIFFGGLQAIVIADSVVFTKVKSSTVAFPSDAKKKNRLINYIKSINTMIILIIKINKTNVMIILLQSLSPRIAVFNLK